MAAQAAAKTVEEPLQFVDINRMAADLGDKHTKTVKRMAQRDPEFPPWVIFGNMHHTELRRWENYKRILMTRGAAVRPLAPKMTGQSSPSP